MCSKQSQQPDGVKPVADPLSINELSKLLVKHYGLTTGKYDLMIEFRLGFGAIGPSDQERLPGAMLAVHRIGLVPAKKEGPLTIDASECE